MLIEPSRTPYDLQFSLFGIPVRVHPFFWLTAVILGSGGIIPGVQPMTQLLMWIAVVFVSILVHEMGHAFAMRYYGWAPRITLYAFGGLASYNRAYDSSHSSYSRTGNTPLGQVIISFAGPLAGFLLAGLVILVLFATGRSVPFSLLGWQVEAGRGESLLRSAFFENDTRSMWLFILVMHLLWVNIYWGLINLLPVYPLDGGQISRELFMAYSRRNGFEQSLIVSVACGGGLALYGAWRQDWWLAILFGILAFQSYQLLQNYRGGWGGGRGW
ncbi:MAG: site-2 protease family protein [Planctomycetes bacterium]|nr:site-2 protease family protein [Planctomycetota bacterium]